MRPHDQKLLHRALPASSPTRLLALLMPLALAACAEAVPDKGADEGAIPNGPPGAPTVLLSPAAPTTTQDVAVVIVAEAVDPDGDAVSYRYLWLEDGAVRDDLTAATLPAAETRKGQVWTVSVIATDGELDGGVGESSATVVNTPPVASVSLPSAPDTEDALVADAAGLDDDGDAVSLRYAWTVDGAASTWADATVPASATARGQVWAVTVTPNDGEEDGAAVSAEVTIANTLPVADAVSLTPSPAYENSVVQAVIAGAADADGDPITPAYAWLVNGVAVSGEGADTLSGAVFDKGDTVQVRVELSDGVGVGATLSSEALTILNSAPTGAAPSISPLPVYEATTASCAPAGWADVDGDPESWQLSWTVNGLAAATGASLTGASFAKGDQLVCVATPDDGEALGSPLSSTPVTVSNTPPSLASATLSTLSPTEATTLSVSLGATADADGDPVSVGYAWTVNGALVSAGATLAPSRFAKGDTVQVVVTPYDGADFGAAVASAPAVVANTAPTVGVVSLSPSSVRTDSTLTASATGADVDGDSVTLAYDWQVNGVPVGGSGASLSGALYFDKGDVVQVTVTPYDGAAFGASRSSSTVTVLNSAPTAPVVEVVPGDPSPGDSLVCEIVLASEDPDGDVVSYSFSWDVDGTAYSGAVDGPTDSVVEGAAVGELETWTCGVSAGDGDALAPVAEYSVSTSPECSPAIDLGSGASFIGLGVVRSWSSARTATLWVRQYGANGSGAALFSDELRGSVCPSWAVVPGSGPSNLLSSVWHSSATCGSPTYHYPGVSNTEISTSWTHLAVVVDGGLSRWYVDGELVASATTGAVTPYARSRNMVLGQSDGWSGKFQGQVDDLAWWNRALSASEVASVFAGGPGAVSGAGLIGWWPMDEAGGTTFADVSGNGANGSIGVNTWVNRCD